MSKFSSFISLQALTLAMLLFFFGCGRKENTQAQPESSSDAAIRSKSAYVPPQMAVNTALVEGVFIRFDQGKQGVIAVTSLHASGAGTPAIAVGDSLQFQLDQNVNLGDSDIERFVDKQEIATMMLKYVRPARFGESASEKWVLLDLTPK